MIGWLVDYELEIILKEAIFHPCIREAKQSGPDYSGSWPETSKNLTSAVARCRRPQGAWQSLRHFTGGTEENHEKSLSE
jgi:hypothetical protein